MYNNNDTITQGRNKAQKQSKDKKLHFKVWQPPHL